MSLSCHYASSDGRTGRVTLEGLPKGSGAPIGNALRRTLLSQLEGAAVTAVRIVGALHEFDSVEGVAEDVTELIANLRQLVLKVNAEGLERDGTANEESKQLFLSTDQRAVTALDIQAADGVEILNPQLHIATLNPGVRLEMEIEVETGRGFRLAHDNRSRIHQTSGEAAGPKCSRISKNSGLRLPVSSDFSPVKRVGYTVKEVDEQYETLTLDIVTNGAVTPIDAMSQATAMLVRCLENGAKRSEFNGQKGQFGLEPTVIRMLGAALKWELLSYKCAKPSEESEEASDAKPVAEVQLHDATIEICTDGSLNPKAAFDAAREQLRARLTDIQDAVASPSSPLAPLPSCLLAPLPSSPLAHSPIIFGDVAFTENAPDLLDIQLESYDWFIQKGLPECLSEMFPIVIASEAKQSDGNAKLEVLGHRLGDAVGNSDECLSSGKTYAAALFLSLRLTTAAEGQTGDVKESEICICDLPVMTEKGTFIINGNERIIVNQLHRSPGAFFGYTDDGKRHIARIIPYRGAWMEFETEADGSISARIDRRKKFPATIILRALSWETNEEILELFADLEPTETELIQKTLDNDSTTNRDEALIEILKRLSPGEEVTLENGRARFERMLFDSTRYDLSRVGRHILNKKFGGDIPENERILRKEDVVEVLKYLLQLNNGAKPEIKVDDTEHLGNRRVRRVGELLQNQFRIGFTRAARVIREKLKELGLQDIVRPESLAQALTEFFEQNQLSQVLQRTNPLDELTHKRRLSAMGPGGVVDRERAEFDVRDLHHSHYGRICPFETPEGPSVGLIATASNHARVNEYGFLEAPYRRNSEFKKATLTTDEIEYLTADRTDGLIIAEKLGDGKLPALRGADLIKVESSDVDYVNLYPQQMLGVSTSLIPLLEHDDPNRALMGANMQRQAVPLVFPEPPLVRTGMEHKVALDSRTVLRAKCNGRVTKASADEIVIARADGATETHQLAKYKNSGGVSVTQRPLVSVGQTVQAGQIIADGCSTKNGLLSLGKNVLVAYMPWEGYNYEDAVVISDQLVKDDVFTSVHIETFRVEARETGAGVECLSRSIPNVPETELKGLDEHGIVKVGTYVKYPNILVGKLLSTGFDTPSVLNPADLEDLPVERRAENGLPSSDLQLPPSVSFHQRLFRLPPSAEGQVIRTEYLSREQGDDLPPGVEEVAIVKVAMRREVKVGDKFSSRHGNKGVIAKIVPAEDMPHLPDGTPVDMILNPLGVPTRMNFGQILETHLGWAAASLGRPVISPPYDGASNADIENLLEQAGLPSNSMTTLYDGRTGRAFDMDVTVGYQYQMKLHHLVDDKIHARSIGPYSILTGQPLGGRSQFGGQRLGEMEVWALQAYGAAHTLYEMLTVKSNAKAGLDLYKKIAAGEEIHSMDFEDMTRSFEVLSFELRGLGIDLTQDEQGMRIRFASSDEIRQWSEGEVRLKEESIRRKMSGEEAATPLGYSLDELPNPNAMGHIELATPVCHIWLVKPSGIFKAWMELRDQALGLNREEIEKVVYCKGHIITDPGDTDLQLKQLLDNGSYKAKREELGDRFKALTGGEAIRWLWTQMGHPDEDGADMDALTNSDDVDVALLAREMQNAGTRPELMVMDVLPVVPSSVRPTFYFSQRYDVESEIGETVASDLNYLYREVIFRNNRVRRLIDLQAPEFVICNEKRLLQEAVDNLLDNGRHGSVARDSKNRPLKSLSDMLKGKPGRFRQNLLGVRVDYSGRSVIVAGPELKLDECGLPVQMALTLFEPFIIQRLSEFGIRNSEFGIKDSPDVIASEAKQSQRSNLGVAKQSARRLIQQQRPEALAALEDVISDKLVLLNRAPTLHRAGIQAFKPVLVDDKAIHLHPLVCPAFNADFDGDQMAIHIPLTPEAQQEARERISSHRNVLSPASGRLLAQPTMDIVLGCYYLTMDGKRARGQEGKRARGQDGKCAKTSRESGKAKGRDGSPSTLNSECTLADTKRAYELGEISLHDSIQLAIGDEVIETTVGRAIFNEILAGKLPFVNETLDKNRLCEIVEEAYREHGEEVAVDILNRIDDIGFHFATRMGASISLETLKTNVNLAVYMQKAEAQLPSVEATLQTTEQLRTELLDAFEKDADGMNPLYLMHISGARSGLTWRLMSSVGVMVASGFGEKIIVIQNNYRGGLLPLEHFTLCKGARRGLADTAIKVASAGYLTRKLVSVAADVVVTEEDCGTQKPRNVVNCETAYGVCAKCYGVDLATGQPVKLGEPVGVIAATALGRPAIQLTMKRSLRRAAPLRFAAARTYFTPIVSGCQLPRSTVKTGLPRLTELVEARQDSPIEVDGATYASPSELLEAQGVEGVHQYLLAALSEIYREQGVEIDAKHFEVIIRQMLSFVEITDAGDTTLHAGQKVSRSLVVVENARAIEKGGKEVTYKPLLYGISKAALSSESFLAAATFQQTTNVLTKAALRGAVDPLRGLRECVIAGKLIPAGTGFGE